MKIKDTPKVDRPQEKLVKYGPKKLTDAELLAIILRTGTAGENVVELAQKVIRKFKHDLFRVSINDLTDIKGLGTTKAAQIVAAFELSTRHLKKENLQVISPKVIFDSLLELRQSKKEQLVVFYLDARNREYSREIISIGTLNANLIHPREIFEPAVRNLANSVVLAHNHPTGEPEPSEDDIEITAQIVKAGKILGIEVLDHVIIGSNSYVSLKKRGLL